jgi:hypothetical protein
VIALAGAAVAVIGANFREGLVQCDPGIIDNF